ncbi:RING finger domain protein [Aspergillus sclerotioniger CBS 115572]|uniref:RING finger domain protein n=1 Tax=Aspergillus sclerotioniger CBS 115572 TaxID=1450535 RepID=A0A317X877_9EURO|nr:RING finger domain protein [Aspergillus sclerotioniger CBS 115572]PWY93777.1 RING finger domain protein [Aspergillus sclerotioniger CBS 115572]
MGVSRKTPSHQQYASPSTPTRTRVPRSRPVTSTPTSSKRKRTADEQAVAPSASTKRPRRSHPNGSISGAVEVIDLTGDTPSPPRKRARVQTPIDEPTPERRARRFRTHPPKMYLERAARALTQRMFVVGHTVTDVDDAPKMSFDIVGTTGNIYKTTIGKVPTCTCPDAQKGNQCKHICYVLVKALRAPRHLQYQLAFLSSELRDMYHDSAISRQPDTDENKDGNRKPVEGDCPICFMEFEPDNEEIVWCRAACGNNIHRTCFQKWAATQQAQGVRCVYCRSSWQTDASNLTLDKLVKEGTVSADGYLNVAEQVGLSGARDYSTYHSFWVRQQSSYIGSPRRRHPSHLGEE